MKIVRLAIFLTGIVGFGMGGVMAISSLKTNQEEALLRTHDQLKSQSSILVDQFFNLVETVKSAPTNDESLSQLPTYISQIAILKLKDGAPAEFESFKSIDAALNPSTANQVDYSLEDRILSALKTDLSLSDLSVLRVAYGTYSLTDIGNREGIFVATPIYGTLNGVSNPAVIEKVKISLIDPVKAFAGISKLGAHHQNAYLMNRKGKVLAHSISAFVGTDLKRVSGLHDAIENLFLGAQTGKVGRYTNVEGSRKVFAIVRAGTTPFAFAVEQEASPAILSSAWISDSIDSGAARKNLGVGFMMLAIALLAFSAISWLANREVAKQIEAGMEARLQREASIPVFRSENKLAPSAIKDAVDQFTEVRADRLKIENEAAAAKAALQEALVPEPVAPVVSIANDFDSFLTQIQKAYAGEAIEQELTRFSADLADSPVLYFRYHKKNQALSLTSTGGKITVPNYSSMHAFVRKDIESQVESLADEGKVASISNYGPINKLIMNELNVAHFEAWGVTSGREISGQCRLVGVLVILQAGTKSAQARPQIAKVLKEAGNYLYAAQNKLKPRSAATVYELSEAPSPSI